MKNDSVATSAGHGFDLGNNEDAEKKKKTVTFVQRIRNFLNFFTVEPFLLCYILPSIIASSTVQKLNMEKACRADLNYTEIICSRVVAGEVDDNITIDALNGAQVLVADMQALRQPFQSAIPAIMMLFVGAWSDKTGNRKALMLIPLLGDIFGNIGLILATYFFLEWPLWATGVIEALPSALTGGISIALMGSYSFVADATSVDSRTFRLGAVAVIATLSIPIGTALSGVLTEAVGYYAIFAIGLVIYIIGFIHTYFRVHDVRKTEIEGTCMTKIIKFFDPKNAWDTLAFIFKSRARKVIQVLLVICAHIVIVGPVMGEGMLLYLYVLKRFNFNIIDFSLFSTYSTLLGVAGTAIAVTVFSKLLKMHDAFLGIIATACKVVSSFVYAYAPTVGWFYSGPAFDLFGNSGVTAIRSLGTKVVEPDEVGKMCSLIGLVEAIVPIIYVPIYNKLYSNTLETFPGAYYVLGGVMTIPAFFIFIFLYLMHKRQQRDVVKDPAAKEAYAHDNDVTSL